MQETRVWSLVQKDPIGQGATKPISHNYWACAPRCAGEQNLPVLQSSGTATAEPMHHNDWSPCAPGPVLHSKRRHCNEKPGHYS